MAAIAIRYLNGWAMATDSADRERAEWPPHPDRVFMALAAAHFETDGDDGEREALRWLEEQDAPGMWASEANDRTVVTTYVPVNDTPSLNRRQRRAPSGQQMRAGLQLLPETRSRQPRQFPVAIPLDPTVYLVWPEEPPPGVRAGLESLCGKMVRVGHSASLVQAWVEDAPPAPNLVRTDGVAHHYMRVPGPGRLEHLAYQHSLGRRPERSPWAGYARPQPEEPSPAPGSVFQSGLLVLRRVDGRLMGLESALLLTTALRNAVIRNCPQPVPEWVGGHDPQGRPSQSPHLAFLPLPFAGSEHADGHLLGLALAIPEHVEPAEAGRCLNPALGPGEDGVLRRVRLYGGNGFEWALELESRDSPPVSLRSDVWTGPARRWATVTPVVFDRHPKGQDREAQAERMVADACEHAGLPRPRDVVLSQVSLHLGVPHSRRFPPLARRSGGRPQHLHAVVTFAEPVRGPVILGAGRYLGYGMCRPVRWEGNGGE